MTIHREGIASIILAIVFGIIVNAATYFLTPNTEWVKILGYVLSGLILVIVLQFFRLPIFPIQQNNAIVLCPADGKVVVIEEVYEAEYFKDQRIQVSVFMSPINVHVNRNPINGIVKYAKYHAGLYLVAWHPKSSTENERTTIVYEHANKTQILMRQIAGALARRICYYVKTDDVVSQGSEMGFIKFGSRVDLFFPLGTKINVSLNQVVKGGITQIAEIA
jgi:phosphatidylserine decarboxylase